jgi:hypothetical protein
MSAYTKILVKFIGKEKFKLKRGMGSKWVVVYMFNTFVQREEVHPIFMLNLWFKVRA